VVALSSNRIRRRSRTLAVRFSAGWSRRRGPPLAACASFDAHDEVNGFGTDQWPLAAPLFVRDGNHRDGHPLLEGGTAVPAAFGRSDSLWDARGDATLAAFSHRTDSSRVLGSLLDWLASAEHGQHDTRPHRTVLVAHGLHLGTAVFSFVFISQKLASEMPVLRYVLTLAGLFSVFLYSQELQWLGNALMRREKTSE
jgi:hypothetical protein